jgi:hypothetical protein
MLETIILIALAFVAGAVLSYLYMAKTVEQLKHNLAFWERYFDTLKSKLEESLVFELAAAKAEVKSKEEAVKGFTASEIADAKAKVKELLSKLLL